jgi:hypothetical protein
MYYSPLFTTASQRSGTVFYLTLEEIRRFGREEFVEPISELSAVVEGNCVHMLERERKRW